MQGTLSVQGGTFTSNTTAISSTFSATLSMTGSRFTDNTGREGGAIYNFDGLTATDDVFTANHAIQGGAVDQDWCATLAGDLFTRNTATASGGGLYAGYHTMVRDSALTRNTAGSQGGAIFSHSTLGATAGIAGSTVAGNVPDNCAPPGRSRAARRWPSRGAALTGR